MTRVDQFKLLRKSARGRTGSEFRIGDGSVQWVVSIAQAGLERLRVDAMEEKVALWGKDYEVSRAQTSQKVVEVPNIS